MPCLAAVAALLAGCGGGGGAQPTRPLETIDPPAKLPRGWRTEISPAAGFSIGVPPLWSTRPSGGATLLSSPDKAVAIQIAADRTSEALSIPLESFAAGAARSLPGFNELKMLGDPMPFSDRYEGVSVRASGIVRQTGFPQRLQVVVLRRDAIAAYPILAAVNARKGSVFAKQIEQIVRSLRGRPIEGAATG